MNNKYDYLDVNSLDELPKLKDKKYRYLDFIGGTKEFRAFIVPLEMTRSEFVKYNSYLNQYIIIKE